MEKKYIIIPGCSDLNRGDQALVWETKRLAEENGFTGKYYLTAERNEPVEQSKSQGIHIIRPVMEHPSRIFKNKQNMEYNFWLKLKWGFVSAIDFFISLFYLKMPTRNFVKLFLSQEKKYSLKIFEECEAVFVKGGGLFQAYGGLSSTYAMYFWCFHLFLAQVLKKQVYVMPNSFGPFEGPFVKKIMKKALKGCTVVSARESLSADMVKEQLGLQIPVYPDLAFQLPVFRFSKEQVLKELKFSTERKLVALTMRPYRFPQSKQPQIAYKKFKMEMAAFIHWLYEKGYMPVVVEHTLAVNSHENDGACIREVLKMVEDKEYYLVSDKKYTCYDLKKIYSCCDYIVGTRFHSVIFSLGSNVPGIAICYVGNKAQGIMHDIGLDDYMISIYDVTKDKLSDKFEKLIQNEKSVLQKIKQYNSQINLKEKELMKKCKCENFRIKNKNTSIK